jgi:type IV pilus assembly protein PilA
MLMFLKKAKKNRKGYTLTELIVVVAILGILAVVATPMVLNQVQNARTNTDSTNAKAIENAYKLAVATATTAPATPANLSDVRVIIGNTMTIPTPQQTGHSFYLNTATGEVTCAATSTTSTGSVQLTSR